MAITDIKKAFFEQGQLVESNSEGEKDALKTIITSVLKSKELENENKKLRYAILKKQSDLEAFEKKFISAYTLVKDRQVQGFEKEKSLSAKLKKINDSLEKRLFEEKKKNEGFLLQNKKLTTLLEKTFYDKKKLSGINDKFIKSFSGIQKKAYENAIEKTNKFARQAFERKLQELALKLKEKEEFSEAKHKKLLRQHHEIKLEINKRLEDEKEKTVAVALKHKELMEHSKNLLSDNLKLQAINKKIFLKLGYLEQKSLANEKELERRVALVKEGFEAQLKELAKQYVEKEVEYKAKIDSLTSDLRRYYSELKSSKEKYYLREKKIKEKLNEALN